MHEAQYGFKKSIDFWFRGQLVRQQCNLCKQRQKVRTLLTGTQAPERIGEGFVIYSMGGSRLSLPPQLPDQYSQPSDKQSYQAGCPDYQLIVIGGRRGLQLVPASEVPIVPMIASNKIRTTSNTKAYR